MLRRKGLFLLATSDPRASHDHKRPGSKPGRYKEATMTIFTISAKP